MSRHDPKVTLRQRRDTTQNDVPGLLAAVEQMLRDLESNPGDFPSGHSST